jgi:rSAM/selenodomain-associated transferase 1
MVHTWRMAGTDRLDAMPDVRDQHSCGIAVMAKASVPGRTKTRLTPPLTATEAAAFNTAFLKDVSANLLAAAQGVAVHGCAIHGYMAYGPPGTQQFFIDHLPGEIGLIESWLPNFGDCLFEAIGGLFAAGHASAVVLNSDSPTLPTSLLVETAEVLARPGDRAVLGPSTDGGYYLLGIKQTHRRLFDDIDWSTDRVAGQTLARAQEIGLDVHCLPAWYDVDDSQSLRQLHAELFGDGSLDPALTPFRAANTADLMTDLLATADLHARLGLSRKPSERLAS